MRSGRVKFTLFHENVIQLPTHGHSKETDCTGEI